MWKATQSRTARVSAALSVPTAQGALYEIDTRLRPQGKQGPLAVSFKVKNTGSVAGKEIAQLYVRDVQSSLFRPDKELKGFAKVALQPGQETTVTMPQREIPMMDRDNVVTSLNMTYALYTGGERSAILDQLQSNTEAAREAARGQDTGEDEGEGE